MEWWQAHGNLLKGRRQVDASLQIQQEGLPNNFQTGGRVQGIGGRVWYHCKKHFNFVHSDRFLTIMDLALNMALWNDGENGSWKITIEINIIKIEYNCGVWIQVYRVLSWYK